MIKKETILSFILAIAASCLNAQILLSSGGGGNYIISNYPGNFTGYYDGFSITFKANHPIPLLPPGTTASMSISGFPVKPIVNTAGNNLLPNDIRMWQVVTLVYDNPNARFQMVSTSGNLSGGPGFSAARDVNLANIGTNTTISVGSFDATSPVGFDDAGTFDGVSYVIPATGIYLLNASATFFNGNGSSHVGVIILRGGAVLKKTFGHAPDAAGIKHTTVDATILVKLVAGEAITVQVFNNSGADVSLAGDINDGFHTRFSGYRVY